MPASPKASAWAATGAARLALRVQNERDGDTPWARRSPARRVLLCVAILSSLAQEAFSMSSVHSVQLRSSPQLPPRGWPAFLTAPHLQQSWTGAPGAPLPCCRRSPQAPNAAPQRVLPVALVSLGITYNPRNVPWALHASAGVGQGTVAQVERDAAWDQRLEELRLFKEGTGGVAHVSQGDPERMALGEWCMTQRKTEKLGRLRADRKTRLLELGVVVPHDREINFADDWVKLVLTMEGDSSPRGAFPPWLHQQLHQQSEENQTGVEIGFVFDLQEVAWQQSFEELRLFAKANEGVSHVSHSDPERPELGTWCRKQRTQEKRGSLRADRKARLLEIGFDFDRQEVAWNQRLEELRLVAEGNGGVAHVHQRDPERPELGRWCDNQRARVGTLRPDRKARLRKIGFVFDPLEAAWEQSFEELRMVAAGNGGVAHVSQSDPERPALGRWCHWQRALETLGKLRPDRKAPLLKIGFVFDRQEVALDRRREERRLVAKALSR